MPSLNRRRRRIEWGARIHVTADPVCPDQAQADCQSKDMHFAGHATPPGGRGPLPACFALSGRNSVRQRAQADDRHRMDGAWGYFPSADGKSHCVPCSGYCGPFYSATLFPDLDSGVQDRLGTACTEPAAFSGAQDKTGVQDLAALVDPDWPCVNPCWITQDRLVAELDSRGIRVVVRTEGAESHSFVEGTVLTR
jgi:hypothetical protein